MARKMSAEAMAKRLKKWADVGIDATLVDAVPASLKTDATASRGRAPKKSGRLAATVRVVRPSVAYTKRTGKIRASVAAGSRSGDRRKAVAYASVHQKGTVGYPATSKTRKHVIRARAAAYSGQTLRTTGVLSFDKGGTRVFARSVNHPGSRFKALGYLKVDEARAAADVDRALQKSADREL